MISLFDANLTARPESSEVLQRLRAILTTPPESVDFARAKLTFDQIVDPSVDIDASMRQIEE